MLCRGTAAGADHGADHQRRARLAAEHVAELSGLIEDLVEADAEEVGEYQLGHRTQTGHRGAGRSAAAQHSQSPYHIFTSVPGLKVVVPSNAYDAKGLLIQAIRDDDPVVFCEHKLMYDLKAEVPDEPYTIPFGEANVVRDGDDVTVVALARMVHYATEAVEKLAAEGIECELIDPRTTSPLDEDTILESVERTGRLVVVDEATPRCSMATDIAALVADKAFAALKAPVRRVTAPHTPVPFAPALEKLYIPDPDRIAAAVREVAAYAR